MSHAVLQRRAAAPAPAHVPESVREVLRRPGQPLPEKTRRAMEARFGHDFSRVRIHADATAARSARDTRAEAWTVGRDIAFGANRWQPDTMEGRRLLAHELTHVLQQSGAAVSPGAELQVSDAGEHEASAAETSVKPGRAVSPVEPSIRRQSSLPLLNPTLVQDSQALQTQAWEVYASVFNQGHRLDSLLARAHGATEKETLQKAYARLNHQDGGAARSLRADIIKEVPRNEVLVRSLALLRHDANVFREMFFQLALDIIPTSVSDDGALNILSGEKTLDGRRRLETEYKNTFWGLWEKMRKPGCPTDEDGLLMHLHYSLTGFTKWKWRFHKCWALLDRDLTTADHIYFNSVAIPDKHRDSLVADFLKVFRDSSFEGIEQMDRWWSGYIAGTKYWQRNPPKNLWCDKNLREAMREELHWTGVQHGAEDGTMTAYFADMATATAWKLVGSTKTYDSVMAILNETDRRKREIDRDAKKSGPIDADAMVREDQRREARVEAKVIEANKGALDYFHNQQPIVAAAGRLRTLHQQQLAGLQPGTPAWEAVQRRYAATREKAQRGVRKQTVADTGTFDALQSSLSPDLADAKSDFNLADELYAARDDYEQVVALGTKYWMQDRVQELWQQAGESKFYGSGDDRPAFQPDELIPRQYTTPYLRYSPMVSLHRFNARGDQLRRGAARLQIELESARAGSRSDSALGEVAKFFATPGFPVGLRAGVIGAWEQGHLNAQELVAATKAHGGTPVERFLGLMAAQFEGKANAWLDLADLLDPVTDKSSPEKAAERAQLRRKATHRSWYNPASMLRAGYDAVTGERLWEHVEENAERLQFIADNYRTNKEALTLMLYISGGTIEELAAQNFRLSEKQARDLKDMQNTCADMFVTALETVTELVAGAITGSASLIPLIRSLAVSLAGMGLREGLMGEDYQFFSGANVKSLVNSTVSFAFLRVDARKQVADRWSNKTMPGVSMLYETHKELGKALAGFVQCGAQKTFESGISNALNIALDAAIFDKAIRPKDIANLGAGMFASVLAGGAAGAAVRNHHPGLISALTNPATLLKETLLFKGGLALNSLGKQVSAVVQGGVGDRSIAEIFGTAAGSVAKTVATTFISAPFDAADIRREMQKSARLALQVLKDPAQAEGMARNYLDVTRKMEYGRDGRQIVVTRQPHERDLKTLRAHEAAVKNPPPGQKAPTPMQFLAQRAATQGEEGDFMDALKPGTEAANNDSSVRSGPIWDRNRGGTLEELQGKLRAEIEQWRKAADKPVD